MLQEVSGFDLRGIAEFGGEIAGVSEVVGDGDVGVVGGEDAGACYIGNFRLS